MIDLERQEVWFVTGSQHLYGKEALRQVDANSKKIAEALDASREIPVRVIFKPCSRHRRRSSIFAGSRAVRRTASA